jgi:hypothetical protein
VYMRMKRCGDDTETQNENAREKNPVSIYLGCKLQCATCPTADCATDVRERRDLALALGSASASSELNALLLVGWDTFSLWL